MTFPGGWAFASRQFRVAAAKIADARPFPILPALLITRGRLPFFLPPRAIDRGCVPRTENPFLKPSTPLTADQAVDSPNRNASAR